MLNRRSFNGLLGLTRRVTGCSAESLVCTNGCKKEDRFPGNGRVQALACSALSRSAVRGLRLARRLARTRLEVASAYIAQFPEGSDLGRERLERYKLKASASRNRSLDLGQRQTGVDGVFLIGDMATIRRTKMDRCVIRDMNGSRRSSRSLRSVGDRCRCFIDKHLSTIGKSAKRWCRMHNVLSFPFTLVAHCQYRAHAGCGLPLMQIWSRALCGLTVVWKL